MEGGQSLQPRIVLAIDVCGKVIGYVCNFKLLPSQEGEDIILFKTSDKRYSSGRVGQWRDVAGPVGDPVGDPAVPTGLCSLVVLGAGWPPLC